MLPWLQRRWLTELARGMHRHLAAAAAAVDGGGLLRSFVTRVTDGANSAKSSSDSERPLPLTQRGFAEPYTAGLTMS